MITAFLPTSGCRIAPHTPGAFGIAPLSPGSVTGCRRLTLHGIAVRITPTCAIAMVE